METQPVLRGFSLFTAVTNQMLSSHCFFFFSVLLVANYLQLLFILEAQCGVSLFLLSFVLVVIPFVTVWPESCLWTDLNGWLLRYFNFAFPLGIVVPIIVFFSSVFFSQTDIEHDESLRSRRVGSAAIDLTWTLTGENWRPCGGLRRYHLHLWPAGGLSVHAVEFPPRQCVSLVT